MNARLLLALVLTLSSGAAVHGLASEDHEGHDKHVEDAGHGDCDDHADCGDHAEHGDHGDDAGKAEHADHADHDHADVDDHADHGDHADHAGKAANPAGEKKDPHGDGHEDAHGHHDDHDEPVGPHGGRLLREGDFAAEISIFETGVEPQLRVYFYDDGAPLDPAKASLELSLQRLASKPERFSFTPKGDFLLGDRSVAEPHSFTVDVKASWGTHSLSEHYDTFEARVMMKPDVAQANGIASEPARARSLERTRRLTGRIGMASDRRAELRPRFAGVVRQATGRIGEKVAAGSNLAVLENSATLSHFRIDSPLSGVVLDRRAVVGGSAGTDDVLYVVADLSEVWADFDLYGADSDVVHPGETVTIRDDAGHVSADAKIAYVSPLRDVHTQTTLARAILANVDGRWAPGSFVTGTIDIEEPEAAVAVPQSALQSWRGRDAVFVRAGDAWEVRPVLIGRRSDVWLEVLEGLDAGMPVATGNTFVLRAEIEKAGAAHDH